MRLLSTFALLLTLSSALNAEIDYVTQIKPLLVEKCISCHGPLKQEAELRLDAAKFIRQGSESGQIFNQQVPANSQIIQRVTAGSDQRMPPDGEGEPLSVEQIDLLKEWIRQNLPAPENEEIIPAPKDHWAYQKIQRPEIAAAKSSDHPIDWFLNEKMSSSGVVPLQRARPETLLRRLYLDVVGLPPTPETLAAFSEDSSQVAYESVVDQLLSSPQYGERWGRHWMDVWRYSDWNGYKNQLRGSQRHIWHWRDWIIESLNSDKGYDQMVLEMLAGDEVAPLDQDVLRATGFLARNYHNSNRNIWLDATIEHTAKAFLGMTINCARCHDHKYDPIAQKEYYTFRAIFEPHNVRADRRPGQRDVSQDAIARVYDKELNANTYLYQRGDEKHPDKENPLEPDIVSILGVPFEVKPIQVPVEGYFPALQDQIQNEEFTRLRAAFEKANSEFQKYAVSQSSTAYSNFPPAVDPPERFSVEYQHASLKEQSARANWNSLQARYAADRAKYLNEAEAEEIEILSKQALKLERQYNVKIARLERFKKWLAREQARKNTTEDENSREKAIQQANKDLATARTQLAKRLQELKSVDGTYTPVGQIYPQKSTGRRLALAKWIIHRDNPLTARVAINHIWMRLFGTPLVSNVFDFGMRTPRPVQAELLDWLAAELIENRWSTKHIHRLILTSQAYQRASFSTAPDFAQNSQLDSENQFYWRTNVRRLEAEIIRDSLLFVSGQLDQSMSGPDIDFVRGEDVPRRSIYFRHAYEKQMQMMTTFDAASPNECYRRSPSVIPQQALALANSRLSFGSARALAQKLEEHSESNDFIKAAFMKILSRYPADTELNVCEEFLLSQTAVLKNKQQLSSFSGSVEVTQKAASDPAQRARENLIHVLMNHNDFVSVR